MLLPAREAVRRQRHSETQPPPRPRCSSFTAPASNTSFRPTRTVIVLSPKSGLCPKSRGLPKSLLHCSGTCLSASGPHEPQTAALTGTRPPCCRDCPLGVQGPDKAGTKASSGGPQRKKGRGGSVVTKQVPINTNIWGRGERTRGGCEVCECMWYLS